MKAENYRKKKKNAKLKVKNSEKRDTMQKHLKIL